MTLETFFAKFDQFATAPNFVAKMRELVLNLAVQGKLAEQISDEEPAEELVRRVAASLPRKSAENPFLSEIVPTLTAETNYELPVGWTWAPLGHLGVWATGYGFPK